MKTIPLSLRRGFSGLIRRGRRFAVVTHSMPDGDAAGSAAALYRFLRSAGKAAEVVNATPVDAAFDPFFPPGSVKSGFSGKKYDAVFVLDCGDPGRSGLEREIGTLDCPVVNIDHHTTNTGFGDLNIVDRSSRAACEILLDLIEACRIPGTKLTRRLAEPLLHGMLTDTRMFQVNGIGPEYFRKVGRLLDTGLSYDGLYARITQSNSLDSLRALFGKMRSLRSTGSGRIAWLLIGRRSPAGRSFDLIHFQLLEFLLSVREAKLVFIAFDRGAKGIHVELRSKKPFKAVGPALLLGGGGHDYASGCQLSCPLAEAERRVLSAIRERYPELF